MRVRWNEIKRLWLIQERQIDFGEVIKIFERPYHLSQKNDDPEQWRAIGWLDDRLLTLIFEEREDTIGQYYWFVTAWWATKFEEGLFNES